VKPRDPSSVDAELDLRATDPDEAAVTPTDDVVVEDGADDEIGDGPDPDNPFSLGSVGEPHSAPPPADGTVRRRRDVGDSRPLGPGPMPGPIAGADGTLDLTDVRPGTDEAGPGFLPSRPKRLRAESVLVRVVATAGVIGIATAIGAVMVAVGAAGWVVALVVSTVSVALAALLWRSRRL
jgi:hypothetical protein